MSFQESESVHHFVETPESQPGDYLNEYSQVLPRKFFSIILFPEVMIALFQI